MLQTINEDTILQNIEAGRFSVLKLDEDQRYNDLIKVYPKSWHSQIKQAFRMQCSDMIEELITYSTNFKTSFNLSKSKRIFG
jgi:hypothetical protein